MPVAALSTFVARTPTAERPTGMTSKANTKLDPHPQDHEVTLRLVQQNLSKQLNQKLVKLENRLEEQEQTLDVIKSTVHQLHTSGGRFASERLQGCANKLEKLEARRRCQREEARTLTRQYHQLAAHLGETNHGARPGPSSRSSSTVSRAAVSPDLSATPYTTNGVCEMTSSPTQEHGARPTGPHPLSFSGSITLIKAERPETDILERTSSGKQTIPNWFTAHETKQEDSRHGNDVKSNKSYENGEPSRCLLSSPDYQESEVSTSVGSPLEATTVDPAQSICSNGQGHLWNENLPMSVSADLNDPAAHAHHLTSPISSHGTKLSMFKPGDPGNTSGPRLSSSSTPEHHSPATRQYGFVRRQSSLGGTQDLMTFSATGGLQDAPRFRTDNRNSETRFNGNRPYPLELSRSLSSCSSDLSQEYNTHISPATSLVDLLTVDVPSSDPHKGINGHHQNNSSDTPVPCNGLDANKQYPTISDFSLPDNSFRQPPNTPVTSPLDPNTRRNMDHSPQSLPVNNIQFSVHDERSVTHFNHNGYRSHIVPNGQSSLLASISTPLSPTGPPWSPQFNTPFSPPAWTPTPRFPVSMAAQSMGHRNPICKAFPFGAQTMGNGLQSHGLWPIRQPHSSHGSLELQKARNLPRAPNSMYNGDPTNLNSSSKLRALHTTSKRDGRHLGNGPGDGFPPYPEGSYPMGGGHLNSALNQVDDETIQRALQSMGDLPGGTWQNVMCEQIDFQFPPH